jgi:hypothetical protein
MFTHTLISETTGVAKVGSVAPCRRGETRDGRATPLAVARLITGVNYLADTRGVVGRYESSDNSVTDMDLSHPADDNWKDEVTFYFILICRHFLGDKINWDKNSCFNGNSGRHSDNAATGLLGNISL